MFELLMNDEIINKVKQEVIDSELCMPSLSGIFKREWCCKYNMCNLNLVRRNGG